MPTQSTPSIHSRVVNIFRVTELLATNLVSELVEVVAWGSIFADNEEALRHALRVASAAILPGTTDRIGILPDYLREVAGCATEAWVVPVIVNTLMTPAIDKGVPAIKTSAACKALSVSSLSGALRKQHVSEIEQH